MRITNKNGKIITNLEIWEEAFKEVDSNSIHWKELRSAHSLAVHFTTPSIDNSNGENKLLDCLKLLGFDKVSLSHAEIEHESRFDAYRGNGRIQDMEVWAKNENLPIAICIEAKVDETFGENIPDAYKERKAILKKKPQSKALKRLEELCEKYYENKKIEGLKEIRYQLLFYLAGSISEAKKINGIAFMPVFVYHTAEYNDTIGQENKEDYVKFMDSVHFKEVINNQEGYLLYKNRIDNVDVYSAFIEVKL